jgi:23S rRNA pseudouridine1911/1915/1917 synthase
MAARGATRLDLALIRRHPGMSRRKAREVIEKGQVEVAGRTLLEPGASVAADAAIVWDPNRRALPRARLSLPLLYRDDALLVVDKPAGLLSVPTAAGSDEDTALARVQEFVRHLTPRRPYVGVVHRLDRDTSGALVFALAPATRSALRELFRAHRIERRYVALVDGRPGAEQGVVDLPVQDAYVAGRRRLARGDQPSLPALTRWRVLERLEQGALLELELETGRQHQIRLHLSHLGLPIVGDAVYGGRARRSRAAAPRQMLHARVLGFVHPTTGASVRVESPLPADFRKVLASLRGGRRGPA